MRILRVEDCNFNEDLKIFLKKRRQDDLDKIDESVKKIIQDVVKRGDVALIEYAKKFDNSSFDTNDILLSQELRLSFKKKIDKSVLDAFKVAIKNITNFHEKQKPKNYEVVNQGVKTQSIWKPIDSVGLYIRGGKAVYT